VCDSIVDCPLGDDEIFCDAPICPSTCVCHGLTVYCEGSNLSVVPGTLTMGTSIINALIITHNLLETVEFSHLAYLQLFILDLSWNRISSLKSVHEY
jgi:hypothetical protein